MYRLGDQAEGLRLARKDGADSPKVRPGNGGSHTFTIAVTGVNDALTGGSVACHTPSDPTTALVAAAGAAVEVTDTEAPTGPNPQT